MEPIQMAYERYKIVRGKARASMGAASYSYQPPSPQEIIQIQKKQILDWKENALTMTQKKMLEQISGIIPAVAPDFNNEVTKKLNLIEEWAAGLWRNGAYSKKELDKASVTAKKTLYQNLLNNWRLVLNLFETSGKVNAQSKAQLEKFRESVQELEKAVSEGTSVNYSIISRAMSAANYAKGYVLEYEGQQFYKRIFRELDIEVVATGQMKASRGKGAVDLAQDLVIVSKDARYSGLSLKEFLKRVGSIEETSSVILNNEEQGLLQQGIGIQAKASRDKTVRLKNTKTSASSLSAMAEVDGTIHGTMLQMLLSIADKGIYIAHPEYAAIGNYIMSKQLKNYLGNNMLYLLRDGMYDTYTLFENQLSKNNYAQILNGKLHLKNGCGAFGLRVI